MWYMDACKHLGVHTTNSLPCNILEHQFKLTDSAALWPDVHASPALCMA